MDGHTETGSGSSSILVTFCNLPQVVSSGLWLVHPPSNSRRLVDIGAGACCVGCTGLAIGNSLLYCAWIGPEQGSFLSILDVSTLTVLECVPLKDVTDVHSICVRDEWLYLVSTGTDEVRRLNVSSVDRPSELVWRASSHGSDTHHVNSILATGTRLLCSAFGPKSGERWSTALAGYVVDVESNELLCSGIEHPHSLVSGPDDIYVAESRRARVRGLRTGRTLAVDGYARGLAFLADGRMVAGSSQGRTHSRELETIENPADPGERHGKTSLAFFALAGETQTQSTSIAEVDLSEHGPEVYDITVL